MKRLLVFGGSGGIGRALESCSVPLADRVRWLSSKDCDVTHPDEVQDRLQAEKPDGVLFLSAVNRNGFLHTACSHGQREMVTVNVLGLSHVLTSSMALFRSRGFGAFVYTSSVLSRSIVPGTGLYSASKAFGERLVRQAAAENAPKGVTAVSVRMGYFPTGLWDEVPPPMQEKVLGSIPLGRTGSIDELAGVIRMALENRYLTGSVVDLSGGL